MKITRGKGICQMKTYFQDPNLLIFIPVNRNEMQSKNELKQQSVRRPTGCTSRGSRMCSNKSALKSSVAQILFSRRHLKETARYV